MCRIFSLMAALLLMQYSMLANAVPEQITTTAGVADFPDYRIDAGGNLHLVWFDASVDSGAIFYTLQDPAGTVLIPPVQVNTGGSGNANTWPAMAAVGGLIYIVWQNTNDGEVWFMRLNPSLAPLDGSAVLAADIREVEIPLSTSGTALHPRIRGESSGNLHVVWENSGGGPLEYVKIGTDGNLLNGLLAPLAIGGTVPGAGLPDIDVDTNGHAHIVFGNTAAMGNEVYYAMVAGDTSAVLIDATLLSIDDGLRAGSATVNVDSFDNTLYLVYKQAVSAGVLDVEEIFLVRLNPSLDDRNGDAADPLVLKVSEQQITNGEGSLQWHVSSRIGSDKRIHATYIDFDGVACPAAPYTITDAHVTFEGKVIARDTLTTTGATTGCFPQARLAPRSNRIVWPDSNTGIPGTTEIWSNVFSRVQGGSRGFTCSLGGQDRTAWHAGDLWLLLGLLVLLALRRSRRFG